MPFCVGCVALALAGATGAPSRAAPSPTVRPGLGSDNPTAPAPKYAPRLYPKHKKAPKPPAKPPPDAPATSNDADADAAQRICRVGEPSGAPHPASAAAACSVEIAQALLFQSAAGAISRISVSGPGGYARAVGGAELYAEVGMPIGLYRFEVVAAARTLSGSFTLAAASRRTLRIRYTDARRSRVQYLAIAGFPPGSTVNLFDFYQTMEVPEGRGNIRYWHFGDQLDEIAVDARGEATWTIPASVLEADVDQLIVSDPRQDNSLNGARVSIGP